MKQARSIMLQGTSSHVGKSLLCTALCRIFYQDGFATAPFKAQNMALNSSVTPEGGEIGRAQGVQAEAAGVLPHVSMNPILLKPKQDMQAQIVVMGKPLADMSARDYRNKFLPGAVNLVANCINLLKSQYQILVIEGAGSPAEVNLKDRDIVNMKTAQIADAPVLLVADIDRGGVFASLIGTLELLEEEEKLRIKGFIINKFRGDLELLKPGLDFLEARTGIPVLGVVPYLHDHNIDEEDSVVLSETRNWGKADALLDVAIMHLPRISNFTDINAFIGLPDTRVRYVMKGEKIGKCDLLVIPGTKNTILDLLYLRQEGYDREILNLVQEGSMIAGLCGGYQMLGQELLDPENIESEAGSQKGLGLLPCSTGFTDHKSTHLVKGKLLADQGFWKGLKGQYVKGYEIHMGQTSIIYEDKKLLEIQTRSGQPCNIYDGAYSYGGRVFGSYLHGLFDNPRLMLAMINELRQGKGLSALDIEDLPVYKQQAKYDRLAHSVRQALDMEQVYRILEGGRV